MSRKMILGSNFDSGLLPKFQNHHLDFTDVGGPSATRGLAHALEANVMPEHTQPPSGTHRASIRPPSRTCSRDRT